MIGFCVELDKHRDALICDFSRFYNVRAIKAGQSYTIDEALAYLKGLSMESGSMYFAEKANWKYTMSREALIQADMFDIFVAANSDPKKQSNFTYPRPYEVLGDGQQRIKGTVVSADEAVTLYKTSINTKTDEEIQEINRQKILANKQKVMAQVEHSSTTK